MHEPIVFGIIADDRIGSRDCGEISELGVRLGRLSG